MGDPVSELFNSSLDKHKQGLRVHDWLIYNGTIEQKVAAYLDDHPLASANEVHKQIGGRRDDVLAAVKQYQTGSQGGTTEPLLVPLPEPHKGGTTVPDLVVPKTVHARATPSPTPEVQEPFLPAVAHYEQDGQDTSNGYTPEELESLAASLIEDMPAA